MNIKEQIEEIIYQGQLNETQYIDQILDLVLNALTIEKRDSETLHSTLSEEVGDYAWNSCVDAYEELKNKLRN